ncbi:MAG: STAS domain-containing protein [Proteobacteria bacterium]|nr:STAS domain-containing protein [Pseudomonadota bacterium]
MDLLQVRERALSSEIEIVEVAGEIDVYTAPRLRSHLEEVIARGAPLVGVALDDVRYLDSSGLAALIAAQAALDQRHGRLILITSKPRIVRLLQLTGLADVFTVVGEISEVPRLLEA